MPGEQLPVEDAAQGGPFSAGALGGLQGRQVVVGLAQARLPVRVAPTEEELGAFPEDPSWGVRGAVRG